jgi:hypothetical protein
MHTLLIYDHKRSVIFSMRELFIYDSKMGLGVLRARATHDHDMNASIYLHKQLIFVQKRDMTFSIQELLVYDHKRDVTFSMQELLVLL